MAKPNQNSTVGELKAYIRSKKLNHPLVRLGLKKAELQAGLKKLGHWSEAEKTKKTRKRLSKGQKDFLAGIDDKPKKKAAPKKKAEPKKKDSVTYKGKKFEVAPAPKKAQPKKKTPAKKQYTFTVYLPTDYSNLEALDYYDDRPSDFTYTEDFELPKELNTVSGRELGTNVSYHRFVSKKTYGGIEEFRKAFPDAPRKYTNEWGSNYGYTGGIVKTLSK